MSTLHLPDNIKVHFAGLENMNFVDATSAMGVNYGLYSAFPFVIKRITGKTKSPLIHNVPAILSGRMRHVIQDSGIFSLLFGSFKDLATKKFIYKWYDELVEFTLEHGADVTCVEVDSQAILGVEETWRLRERMRADLPNNRIINVFHIEDEKKGLDRMIEFSDYIAIGSGVTRGKKGIYALSEYIKQRKPDIDIHLLGCTALNVLNKCNFCTSCDSISWKTPLRFGRFDDYHISDLDTQKVMQMAGEEAYNIIRKRASEQSANAFCATIEQHKRWYQKYAGNQDYNELNTLTK